MARSAKSLLILFITLINFGCSAELESFPTLANQGILALSTSNPHLGSNLFLAKEMERSSYLYSFLQGKGAPTAIQIEDERFAPPRVLMYYPSEKEVYAADLMHRKKEWQWIVRGPYGIERQDFRELLRMDASLHGEPVFIINGRQQRFRQGHQIIPTKPKNPVLAVVPEVVPTPVPHKKPHTKTPVKTPEIVVSHDFKPLNSDQQAIAMSQGWAERADNGDVIHTVKGQGETFTAIANWYTGSAAHVSEIAVQNNLVANDQPLAQGMRIRIPLKLVKQFKAMSESH